MSDAEQTFRVKQIKVTNLFGLYDHVVSLKEDRITVIHGPNGVGKTVFLKLTNSFLSGRYNEMIRVPFHTFEILFEDGSRAFIRQDFNQQDTKRAALAFIASSGITEESFIDTDSLSSRALASQISDQTPYFTRIGPEEWLDRRTDEVLTADDVVARAGDFLPKAKKKKGDGSEPKGLKDLRGKINIHFIEAQRLIRFSKQRNEWRYRNEAGMTATVLEYSLDLKRRLESTLANYAKQSQKLDQTFPHRVLNASTTPFTLEELKLELEAVETTRARLKGIGILDGGDATQAIYPQPIAQLDLLQDAQLSVMSVYAKDTKEKLSVLEELCGRIELLLGVLNRKFANKRVIISRESGLIIEGRDRKTIPITALSSGEQHEIVMLYDLLFKVKEDTLVLIDEPELSLHISWQKGFLDDLSEIIKLAQFDVLMATHSPYIVGDRSDLLVILSSDPDSSLN